MAPIGLQMIKECFSMFSFGYTGNRDITWLLSCLLLSRMFLSINLHRCKNLASADSDPNVIPDPLLAGCQNHFNWKHDAPFLVNTVYRCRRRTHFIPAIHEGHVWQDGPTTSNPWRTKSAYPNPKTQELNDLANAQSRHCRTFLPMTKDLDNHWDGFERCLGVNELQMFKAPSSTSPKYETQNWAPMAPFKSGGHYN